MQDTRGLLGGIRVGHGHHAVRPGRAQRPEVEIRPGLGGFPGLMRATFMDRPTAARTSPGAGPARTTTVLELRRIGSIVAARTAYPRG